MKLTFDFVGDQVSPSDYNATYGVLNDYAGQADFLRFVLNKMAIDSGRGYSILDVGCGTGLLARDLQQGLAGMNYSYTGIDVEAGFIEHATLQNYSNAQFKQISFPECFSCSTRYSMIFFGTYLLQAAVDIESLVDAIQLSMSRCEPGGVVVFSFFDEVAYLSQYEDGHFCLNALLQDWEGDGGTWFHGASGKRSFKLEFCHGSSGVRFGSLAQYLPLTQEVLQSYLLGEYKLRFYGGKGRGLEADGARWWCVVGSRVGGCGY